MNAPTIGDVERISSITDPIVRNLQITQCYHELSQAIAGWTGAVANWCTFATWASKQAGQTIRQEDLRQAFDDLFHGSPEIRGLVENLVRLARSKGASTSAAALWETIRNILNPSAAFARASDAVARGNKKVFEEIAREFARYLAEFQDDALFDAKKMERFCAGLRSGEPPDGQEYLRQAFAAYCGARFEADPGIKGELMFYGNLLTGLHEQTRLQPEIAEALEASIGETRELRKRILAAILPGTWLRLRNSITSLFRKNLPLDDVLDRLIDRLKGEIRRILTESLMTIHLPQGEILRLGNDLRAEFPLTLRQLAHPELRQLLTKIDPTTDTVLGSGTDDWASFPDRMHFITDFFRCYHERNPLFDAPFTPEQIPILKSGRKPAGAL